MAVLNVPVVFGAHAAVAQSSPPPVAIHQLPSYCQRSTLTGVKFMQMVQAIIAHGDLTDIAFLEKTFGTKFNLRPNETVPGELDPQSHIYVTDKVSGNPIDVHLFVAPYPAQRTWNPLIAKIRIESQSFPEPDENFVSDCLHITGSNFSSYFGGGFHDTFVTHTFNMGLFKEHQNRSATTAKGSISLVIDGGMQTIDATLCNLWDG